jgi:hypothetical protein
MQVKITCPGVVQARNLHLPEKLPDVTAFHARRWLAEDHLLFNRRFSAICSTHDLTVHAAIPGLRIVVLELDLTPS